MCSTVQETHTDGIFSPQSDSFMFGMLVFEALTGKVPFFADAPTIAAKKILDGERPPRPADAALDAGTAPLWALHVECTVRDPAARPAPGHHSAAPRRAAGATAGLTVRARGPLAPTGLPLTRVCVLGAMLRAGGQLAIERWCPAGPCRSIPQTLRFTTLRLRFIHPALLQPIHGPDRHRSGCCRSANIALLSALARDLS